MRNEYNTERAEGIIKCEYLFELFYLLSFKWFSLFIFRALVLTKLQQTVICLKEDNISMHFGLWVEPEVYLNPHCSPEWTWLNFMTQTRIKETKNVKICIEHPDCTFKTAPVSYQTCNDY
jgi:hypothetical protein